MPSRYTYVSTPTSTSSTLVDCWIQEAQTTLSAYQELDRVTSARRVSRGPLCSEPPISISEEPPVPQRTKKLSAFSLLVLKEKEIKEKL